MKDVETIREDRGGALFGVMVFVMIMSIVIGTVMSASSYRTTTIDRVRNRMQAEAYAEAGANFFYAVLITNWSARNNYPPDVTNQYGAAWSAAGWTEFGEGAYAVSIDPVGDQRASIMSVGFCGNARAIVIMDALNYGDADDREWDERWWESEAWEFAMISGSTFDFGGCGSVETVDDSIKLHSNSDIVLRGNSDAGEVDISSSVSITANNWKCDIGGDATAPVFSGFPPADIAGTQTVAAVPPITIPDINLTPWQNEALKGENGTDHPATGDTYMNGDLHVAGGDYLYDEPTVWWIEGDLILSSFVTLSNLEIIATGDILISAWGKLTPPPDSFSLVSISGDIKITGQADVDAGVIYTKTGDFEQTGGGQLDAQLVITGEISKKGNAETLVYSGIIPMPPDWDEWPDDTPGEDIIGVSAWQK